MEHTTEKPFLFGKQNYIVLLAGVAVIALGFLLMAGGNSHDPNVFNEAVFSSRRIHLAPAVIFIGFGICIYSIFKKPSKKSKNF